MNKIEKLRIKLRDKVFPKKGANSIIVKFYERLEGNKKGNLISSNTYLVFDRESGIFNKLLDGIQIRNNESVVIFIGGTPYYDSNYICEYTYFNKTYIFGETLAKPGKLFNTEGAVEIVRLREKIFK